MKNTEQLTRSGSNTATARRKSGVKLGQLEYINCSRILSDGQIKKLKEHKYSCLNESLFDPYLQPYWNWLVGQIPVWLAPNLITIIGLALNIVTSLILVYYSPDCRQNVPSWTLIMCALGLFFYQSLDAIDGKQARRTNSQSPLGELFDHGCDSVSTVFVSIGVCVSCKLGDNLPMMFLQCMLAITLFYCAHWQAYVAGTLRFGKIDVTEAQIGIMIVHLLTAAFGGDFWAYTLIPGTGIPVYVLYVFVALGGALPALRSNFKAILYCGAGKNGSSVAGTSVLSPVIPFSLVIIPAVLIAWRSEENIYGENPALYILMFGIVSAKITNRLVVAHMTRSEMDYLDVALLGPFILFMNQYLNCVFREKHLLWIGLILATMELYRYSSKVCLEICDSMGIFLFRIDTSEFTSKLNAGNGKSSSTSSSNVSSSETTTTLRHTTQSQSRK